MSNKKYLIGLLASLAVSISSAQQNPMCAGEYQQCTPSLSPVVETPAGPLDGVNGTFTLTDSPTDGKVRFFDNGIEYPQEQAFTVSGKTLSLRASLAPRPGDVIRVCYLTAAPQPGTAGRNVGSTSSHEDMLVRQSLLEAMLREAAPVGSAPDGSAATTAVIEKTGLPHRALGSISMLSRKFDNRQKPKARQHDEADATGFEGLGDLPAPNPYSALILDDNGSPVSKRAVVPVTTAPDHRAKTSRALVMLQQRLEAAQAGEEQE